MPYLKKKNTAEFTLNAITEIEISTIVEKLPNKTSIGYDGISNVLVKKLFYTVRYPLCIIFNKSFIGGMYPDQFKLAKVIPLHKGGEKDGVDNYRPILLLTVMSKILEKLMFKQLSQFMQICLYHSTTHAIAELVREILWGFNNDMYTLALFIDLRKAYACVDHNILLNKLSNYIITGVAHDWFDSYLHD